jgi:hypothetical protein
MKSNNIFVLYSTPAAAAAMIRSAAAHTQAERRLRNVWQQWLLVASEETHAKTIGS